MTHGDTRTVKMLRDHTPRESRRTLYPGSEYELSVKDAYEVVEERGFGEYVAPHQDEVDATEAAKREAAQANVDLKEVKPSGSHGQVTVEDVRKTKGD